MDDNRTTDAKDSCRTSGQCPICHRVWPILGITLVAYVLAMLLTPPDPYSGLPGFLILMAAMFGSYWLGLRQGKR